MEFNDALVSKLRERSERFEELTELIGSPEVLADAKRYPALLRERGSLEASAKMFEAVEALRQQRAERPVHHGGHSVATMGLDSVQVWQAGELLDDFRVLEFELVRAADMNVLDEISAVLAKDGLKPGPVAKLNRALAAVEVARKGTRDVA